MIGAFFKFVLPISVTGTGIATALNSSNTSSEKGNVPTNTVMTHVATLEEQSTLKTSLPNENPAPILVIPEASAKDFVLPEGIESAEPHYLKTEEVEQEIETIERGNCDFDDSMTSILRSQEQKEQDYYSVTCTNVGIDGEPDTSFQNKWKGAFPKALFVLTDLTVTKKLEIKVKTEFSEDDPADENYPYEIKFWSPQFNNTENSTINGNWDYKGDLDDDNSTGAIVKLTHSSDLQNIYLLLDAEPEE
ncbi:hypothetical protein DNK47_02925 [Mycoplasma wenyonii]|uniref:Uncharacterized protein n=1 Tax=Mycoplasma wenyonii TaxID=65123 RepID=A0A328PTP2_9MOLU|nr:hypothetical protein [Mycoplasma wenyonii]RAO94841.1 hypothetical protein DNK47_02925 [Mycoplasma wenyonii]